MRASEVLPSVSSLLLLTRDMVISGGKQSAWYLFLALLTKQSAFRRRFAQIDFLAPPSIFESPRGVALYSVCDFQVNINLLVVVTPEKVFDFLQETVAFVSFMHPGHCINMLPVMPRLDALSSRSCVMRRRMVPSLEFVLDLALQDDHVVCHGKTPVRRILRDVREIRTATPITRAKLDDPPDTEYWHRFPCGTVAAFLNPFAELAASFYLPEPCTDRAVALSCVDERLHFFVAALNPTTLQATLEVVSESWVPRPCRQFCLVQAYNKLGVSDDLILLAGTHFPMDETTRTDPRMVHLLLMGNLMRVSLKLSSRVIVETLGKFLEQFGMADEWRAWTRTSDYVRQVVRNVWPEDLRFLLKKCRDVLHALGGWLLADVGTWSRMQIEKAVLYLETAPSCAELPAAHVRRVRAELARVEAAAVRAADELRAAAPRATSPAAPPPKGVAPAAAAPPQPPLRSVGGVAADAKTHAPYLARLREWLSPLRVDLIGSGLFCDLGDVDVVITCEGAATFAEAYETVARATGWSAVDAARVDGGRLLVISGHFDGVRVDAQVWRGAEAACLCASERRTMAALALSSRLTESAGPREAHCIRDFHEWCSAARLKNNLFSFLPGIGVTCAALVLNRFHASSSLVKVLDNLCDVLGCCAPVIQFDLLETSCDARRDDTAPCRLPLAVIVREENCASRMTALTSRHVLDVARFATSQPARRLTDPSLYDAWRRVNMVSLASVRPRRPCALARYLSRILATLDAHPLLRTLHVQQEEGEVVTLRGTLNPEADPSRYGFSGQDEVLPHDETRVVVKRRARRFTLMTSPRPPTVHSVAQATSVCDLVPAPGDCHFSTARAIPNAPTITCDILARFPPEHWEHC